MHKQRFWIHVAMWLSLYLFWITIFQNHALTISRTVTIEFCYLIFIAGNFYFHLYYTIPGLLYRKRYAAFGGSLAAGLATGAFFRTLLALYMNQHYFHTAGPPPAFGTVFENSLLNISVWVICLLAAHLMIERIRFRKYLDAIEQEKTRNELDFLRSQFNPHFLFNSINSIYGQIDKSNPLARHMLLTFSEILRYQLYECNADSISIDREVHYIRNYVALQQIRKEEDLIVDLRIGREVTGFAIAPLLFIAFIENAFKYVSDFGEKENKVEISIERKQDSLWFSARNTKEKNLSPAGQNKGIGIANVKRRLELLYPGRHDLQIQDGDGAYQVDLKLQI
jgi:two-component system LytT family sensor kinase